MVTKFKFLICPGNASSYSTLSSNEIRSVWTQLTFASVLCCGSAGTADVIKMCLSYLRGNDLICQSLVFLCRENST